MLQFPVGICPCLRTREFTFARLSTEGVARGGVALLSVPQDAGREARGVGWSGGAFAGCAGARGGLSSEGTGLVCDLGLTGLAGGGGTFSSARWGCGGEGEEAGGGRGGGPSLA